ncbi:hypothetical protein M9H77_02663 [Catharanthus roseus]|uniref:Uncharacterized protein n=1 Tax=Catharanthus roseus TaxID=4058 RepID=A0ACC0C968_CATRO|nr:hypothetical protein M9H77_02663 [Catharanthus roseus]
MPPHNSAASSKKIRAAVDPSNNEPILFLPYRIPDETNSIWYSAKLKNRLVVEYTVHGLLESQVGGLDHYWWDDNERRWRLAVQQGGDEQAQAAEEQAGDAVEDDEKDDFLTAVTDQLEHLQIRQEKIQHQLQIHQENTQNRLQIVKEMMQCQHEMLSYLYGHFSSNVGSSGSGAAP